MSSKSPVPSRAALNALRGVLFTTSCSVFLLAEERRRRLNIARAAIENAKKLHTVRSNRGAIALTSEVVEEIASPPTAERPLKNPHRRRRRDDLTNYILNDPDLDFHHHGTDLRNLDSRLQGTHAVGSEADSELGSSRPPPLPPPLRHDPSFRPLQFLAPAIFSPRANPQSPVEEEAQGGTAPEVTATGSNRRSTSPVPSQLDGPRLPFEKTLETLRSLLNDKTSNDDMMRSHTHILEEAIVCLQHLVHLQPSSPILGDIFQTEGLEVLKRAVEMDRSQVPAVLTCLRFSMKDCSRILSPFLSWLQKRDDPQDFKDLLNHLMDYRQGRLWSGGMLLYRLLCARSKIESDYERIKSLYDMLLKAGLFDTITVNRGTEYRIRRLIFSRALAAGDEATAQDEMNSICRIEPENARRDVKLQGVIIAHEASCGRWDAVQVGLVALTQPMDAASRDFRRLLVQIIDMFAKAHGPEELESLLRDLASHYKIPLKHRWVDRILDGHASRRETGKMLSWLQFCSEHGLKVDDKFIGSYISMSRKYLGLSKNTIQELNHTLGRPVSAELPLDPAGDSESQASSIDFGSLRWASKAEALKFMQALEARKDWKALTQAYVRFQHSGLGFSEDIVRLAVLGHLKGGGPAGMDQASALMVEARDQGHGVAGTLTPLLIARMDRGDDPGGLIKSALSHGIKVHNSVYNKATQSTLARGDAEGAIQLCRLAARENGRRCLLYSEHNFLNLVFACMSAAQYGALVDVVTLFTSRVDWWKGSQRCKMSIKFAMKTAAMRAATAANPLGRQRHEAVLLKLDEALVHVARCRVVVGERRAVKDALVRMVKEPEGLGLMVAPPRELVAWVAASG